MLERPISEGFNEVREARADSRESVVNLGGDGRIDRANNESVPFEPAQRHSEHPLRDPVDRALQLAKSAGARRQLDDDEHRPLVATRSRTSRMPQSG